MKPIATTLLLALCTLGLAATTLQAADEAAAAPPTAATEAKPAPAATSDVPAAPPKSADGRLQLRCLVDVPENGRFTIPPDRVWPAKAGEADVCIWADDKLAAASITIDDNWTPDHPWWIAQGEKTGFRFTWFVITERVGTGGLWGTWDAFKKLKELGHDVQSHTVSHLHVEVEGWKGIDWEYGESVKQIAAGMPGHTPICLAYPGGKNSTHNDPKVAAKYYIAGRGVTGAPNSVNRTKYIQTNSTSLSKENIDKVLDKDQLKKGKYGYYRGWLCTHYHGVNNNGKTDEEKKANNDKLVENIQYLKSKEADIWVGLFREVVLYGQERDTAKLKVTKNDPAEIRFTLTDDMDDTLFAFPLTVKVRLPDGWKAAAATQDGKPADAKTVEHEGARFALVKAVPDKGEVTLKAAEN